MKVCEGNVSMSPSCPSILARTHIPLARTHQTYLPVLSSGRINEFGESASLCLKIIMAKSNIYNSLILLRHQAKHFIYIMFKLIHSFKVYSSVVFSIFRVVQALLQ